VVNLGCGLGVRPAILPGKGVCGQDTDTHQCIIGVGDWITMVFVTSIRKLPCG
jgi:hypothetical protein